MRVAAEAWLRVRRGCAGRRTGRRGLRLGILALRRRIRLPHVSSPHPRRTTKRQATGTTYMSTPSRSRSRSRSRPSLPRRPPLPPLRQPSLELLRRLVLDLLPGDPGRLAAGQGVPRRRAPVLLLLVEVLDDAVAVLLEGLLRDALHAEDFDVEARAVGQGVLDLGERLLVDLVHVDGETCEGLAGRSCRWKGGGGEGRCAYRRRCLGACRTRRT